MTVDPVDGRVGDLLRRIEAVEAENQRLRDLLGMEREDRGRGMNPQSDRARPL